MTPYPSNTDQRTVLSGSGRLSQCYSDNGRSSGHAYAGGSDLMLVVRIESVLDRATAGVDRHRYR